MMSEQTQEVNTWPEKAGDHDDFDEEMNNRGESMKDAVRFTISANKSYTDVLAVWTVYYVYFPVGECCPSVDSVPIPEHLHWE